MHYRPMPLGRWFIVSMFVVFTVVAIALSARTIAAGDHAPPVYFTLMWLGLFGWNAYWWLLRISRDLTLDDDRLRWSAPLTGGDVTDELGRRRPDLPVRLGWQARFAERLPGRSGFR